MRLARAARMDIGEIAWRGRAAVRIALDRFRASRTPPAWNRADLIEALAPGPALDDVRLALAQGRWRDANGALASRIACTSQRFALAASNQRTLAPDILNRFPGAAGDATARAEKILSGRYDLLGYRGLTFEHGPSAVDWQRDPVHGRQAPAGFWADVPYLDPRCGDHKIIWELNRHQHWLTLGRAFWLTGDGRYRERFLTELRSWLDGNPPLSGINWASMLELAFRSISWTWALAFFAGPGPIDESPWIVDLLLALDRQLTQVERNLSYYFSPNTHLLGEALALYVCSRALPLLRRSAEREDLGRAVLVNEARRQISADGGHCERSTHYHRYTLDFYLLALIVARITKDPAAREFGRAVSALADAARLLADDRGQLPQIGDDDGGMLMPMTGRRPLDIRDSLAVAAALLDRPELAIGEPPEEAYWLLAGVGGPERAALRTARAGSDVERPFQGRGPKSGALRDTGYYVSRSRRGDHLVIDGGVHGYLNGGHAHADALSLTLTVAGTPLLVDPGTGAYTIDQPLRDRLRSSHLHNTLVVDGRSQSIANGPFSWQTMARSTVRRWETHQAFDYFEGVHDGYHPIEHRRHVLVLHGDLMVVADLVTGDGTHTAAAHWHVDPRWHVEVDDLTATFAAQDARCQLVVPNGRLERFDGDAVTGLGWRAPMYGALEPSTSLRVTHAGPLPFWMASVVGLRGDNAVVSVAFVPQPADTRAASIELRITRQSSIDYVRFGDIKMDARELFWREHDNAGVGSGFSRTGT
jgi:Heparinase II/III-like protein/Heparinase II/III N-terminus